MGLSWIGTQGAVWIVIALVVAFLRSRPSLLVMVVAADVTAQLVAFGLKMAIGRDRPPLRYASPDPLVRVPHGGSFPSGHAASSFACAAILAWAEPRLAAPLLVLAAAIAFSRVYVGVHYPLDVLGGALLGLAVAGVLLALLRRRRRQAVAEPDSG